MLVRAFAKVNLSLEVIGRRSDGYHDIATVMHSVSLADHLTFAKADAIDVRCVKERLSGEANLAWQAASALAGAVGYRGGASIDIDKRIPEAMGLGGGSADAAATLVALNRLWDAGLSVTELTAIASKLGTDAPFFIEGGAAIATGRGDKLQALPPAEGYWLTLVCPPGDGAPDKTGRMYASLQPKLFTNGGYTERLASEMRDGKLRRELLYNAFQEIALERFEAVPAAIRMMRQLGAKHVALSGSGPGLFALADTPREARQLQTRMLAAGYVAYSLRTMAASLHLTPTTFEN